MLDSLARGLDRAVQRAERLVRSGLLPPGLARETTVRDLGFYARRLEDFPETLFGGLRKPAEVGVSQLGRRDGAEVYQVSFPSPCQPLHPEFLDRFESMPENHLCYARWIRPERRSSGTRATCLVLHDWGEPSLGRVVKHCFVSDLVGDGLEVIAPLLPHHGPRRSERARFSGELFLCGDIACTVEAHLQAVRETRALLRWLRERDAGPLGVVGFGLGGLVAALVCGLDRDLDFGVLLASPSRLTALLVPDPAPLLRSVHEDIRRQGLLKRLEEVWSPLDTARLGLALPSNRLRILGARGDGLVPPSELERLARVTASPIEWIGGGHGRPGGALRGGSLPGRLRRMLRAVGALGAG